MKASDWKKEIEAVENIMRVEGLDGCKCQGHMLRVKLRCHMIEVTCQYCQIQDILNKWHKHMVGLEQLEADAPAKKRKK